MREQQPEILQVAAANSQSIAENEAKETSLHLRETLDEEMEKSHAFTDVAWRNPINKSNFDFCKQVSRIWQKTSRETSAGRMDKAKECCETGKTFTQKRLKVLRLADKDGWDAALAYLSDDLADDEGDRKCMRKAKKTAQTNKDMSQKSASRYVTGRYQAVASRVATHPGPSGTRYTTDYASDRETRTCWVCGRMGHLAKSCRRISRTGRP